MSRRRTVALIAVHLLMLGHVLHWYLAGRTLSPIEPSEAMYTLNEGYLNAGFIFFAGAILATLVFGRFLCGWGCHMVAYQDLCAWLLKKCGIRPKPFRSRILVLAPPALALYMFLWPTVYRRWVGAPAPPLTNHMLKTEFWETFPGPGIAVVTMLVCGFAIVYFLGSKGFCTYACPYGAFFGLADKLAPGRILVTDTCQQCGHCTAACTSNVRVHEEVARYGMVVDPGCMKCMDCVSVCPNDALHFGFAKPPIGVQAKSPRRSVPYDFSRWEEGSMVLVGLAALLSYRGLYGKIPLLLAMAMAAITAYLSVKLVRVARTSNVRLQNLQLKRGGWLTRAGITVALTTGLLLTITAHSAVVQYHAWRGGALLRAAGIGDEVRSAEGTWWEEATPAQRAQGEAATENLEWVGRWGLMPTPAALNGLASLYLAVGRNSKAEEALRRMIALRPDRAEPVHGLAGLLHKTGRIDEAEMLYRKALTIDPSHAPAGNDLCALLLAAGRHEGAVAVYRDAISSSSDDLRWRYELGRLLIRMGRFSDAKEELKQAVLLRPEAAHAYVPLGIAYLRLGEMQDGLAHLHKAVELDPKRADAHYNLGMISVDRGETEAAIGHLRQAAALDADVALYHYNLGVATFMAGRPTEALPHIQNAIRLDPDDPEARGFLEVVLSEPGATGGVRDAHARVNPASAAR
jgi:Flp pilus assembly protein TadD/polyferredoxin